MRIQILFVSILIVGSFLYSPSITFAREVQSEDLYRATLLELIDLLQKQIVLLNKESSVGVGEFNIVRESKSIDTAFEDTNNIVIKYVIDDTSDYISVKNNLQRDYFGRVLKLIPAEYSSKIKQLAVFSGRDAKFDAYVETISPKYTTWLYAVHEDLLVDPTSVSNTELIIHEFAHIISYEGILGVPNPAHNTCAKYFSLHSCPAKNSYLSKFVSEFWSEEDLDRAFSFAEEGNDFDEQYQFYINHRKEFVTDYAVSGPEEDFAESFAFYVLNIPVSGEVANNKKDFFESFSKIRGLKTEIRKNL